MSRALLAVALLLSLAGCRRGPEPRQYELVGQIIAMAPARREVTIKHGDIKNFMPGMTMPFIVEDAALLEGKQPGDLVTATLVVGEVEAHLSTLTRTGHADLPAAPPASGDTMLKPGDRVESVVLVDQDGSQRPFAALEGRRVAVTFIYTRCPLPDYCPLMNRHFQSLQAAIKAKPELADVRLVSVTMDPEYDTPAVLKPLADTLQADPKVWSFVTGSPADLSRFATQFGVYIERDPDNAAQLIHNLRTAVIGADGRVVKIETGNSWTPAELVATLETTAAPGH